MPNMMKRAVAVIVSAIVVVVTSMILVRKPQLVDVSVWKDQKTDLHTEGLQYLRIPTYNPNVTLNVIEAGRNIVKGTKQPLVVMLHGFPETALVCWHQQIRVVSRSKEFYVLAPDMRGFNTSDKPTNIEDYNMSELISDVHALITYANRSEAVIIAHDWGGIIAWQFAMKFPDMVTKLIIVDSPHMVALTEGLYQKGGLKAVLKQALASWYIFFFKIPVVPEWLLARNDFNMLKRSYDKLGRNGHISAILMDHLVQAWKEPGALVSMLNYYRALQLSPTGTGKFAPAPINTTVKKPTLLIWGTQDHALPLNLAELSWELGVDESVRDQSRFVPIEDVGHFPPHENPSALARLILIFLKQN
jgi:pimeloyl-ACP methyl ester carboxylesterase